MTQDSSERNAVDAVLVQMAANVLQHSEKYPNDPRLQSISKVVMDQITAPGTDMVATLIKMVGALSSQPSPSDQREIERAKQQKAWQDSMAHSAVVAKENRARTNELQAKLSSLLLEKLKQSINPSNPDPTDGNGIPATDRPERGVGRNDQATDGVPSDNGGDERSVGSDSVPLSSGADWGSLPRPK